MVTPARYSHQGSVNIPSAPETTAFALPRKMLDPSWSSGHPNRRATVTAPSTKAPAVMTDEVISCVR